MRSSASAGDRRIRRQLGRPSSAPASSLRRRRPPASSAQSVGVGPSRALRSRPEPPGTARPGGPYDLVLDEAAPGVVGARAAAGPGPRSRPSRRPSSRRTVAPKGTATSCAERPLAGAHGPGDDPGHPGLALQAGHLGGLGRPDPDLGDQARDRRQRHAGLAERGQHLLDVAQEQRVGPDHQHALALEGEPVGVEEVGGPVQRHRRLAGARAALDDQDAGQRRADDLVLLALDGGRRCRPSGRCGPGRARPAGRRGRRGPGRRPASSPAPVGRRRRTERRLAGPWRSTRPRRRPPSGPGRPGAGGGPGPGGRAPVAR